MMIFFNKFQFVLLCLIVPKMKKVVTKYSIVIISALRVN